MAAGSVPGEEPFPGVGLLFRFREVLETMRVKDVRDTIRPYEVHLFAAQSGLKYLASASLISSIQYQRSHDQEVQ
jgi:hypothetical protein